MLESITILLLHWTGHDSVKDAIPKWQQLGLASKSN